MQVKTGYISQILYSTVLHGFSAKLLCTTWSPPQDRARVSGLHITESSRDQEAARVEAVG